MEEAGQRVDFDGNVVSLYDRKENRPEESGDFKPVENIEGEEFLAVRPWLGQFRDPSNRNPFPPKFSLNKHQRSTNLPQIKLSNPTMSTATDVLISDIIYTIIRAMVALSTVSPVSVSL